MGTKELWSTYNKIVINNERATELIRMVRALFPDEKRSPDDYDFCAVLGVIQDILEKNDEELTNHEVVMTEIEQYLPEENDEL